MNSHKRVRSEGLSKENVKKVNFPKKLGVNTQNQIEMFGPRHTKSIQPTGKYSAEEVRLQEWNQPQQMMFRDDEIKEISSFINKGIKEEGSHVSLYITGMPGQGKTTSLQQVVRGLKEEYTKVGFYYQNALKLPKPYSIFSRFWKMLTDEMINPQKAKCCLDDFFQNKNHYRVSSSGERRLKGVKVLVIDEVDYLLTKNNDILYSMFDWTHAPHSKLLIICVANTLDFPDKIQPKIKSRMGKKHINFAPYTADQIEKIITGRLGESKLFHKEAIVYIARKCASISSDIRKSLHYCRRAIQCHRVSESSDSRIGISLISRLFEADSKKPFSLFLKNDSKLFRSLMVALINQCRVKNKNVFELDLLFNAQNSLLSLVNIENIRYSEFKILLYSFQDAGILRVVSKSMSRPVVNVSNVIDDVRFSLREDELFSKYLQV